MKIKTKLKIKSFKKDCSKYYYKLMGIVFKPLIVLLDRRDRKKLSKESKYNTKKVKRLLYKTVQNELLYVSSLSDSLYDACIYVYDVDWISDDEKSSNDFTLEDLLKSSNNKYLQGLKTRDRSIIRHALFDILLDFNDVEITVEEVSIEDLLKDYKYYNLYKNSKRVLKITFNPKAV